MQVSFKVGKKQITAKENLIDKAVRFVSPELGERRLRSRLSTAVLGGYTAGKRDRRALKGWNVAKGDADSDTLTDLQDIREHSRDLNRNNPLAVSAISTNVVNVLGPGLRYQSRINRRFLGLSEEEAEEWEENAEIYFNAWADSQECDAARTLNFGGIQNLTYISSLDSGDSFVTMPMFDRPGSPFRLKLQVIEADRVCNKDNVADREDLAAGVETDINGAPISYHFAKKHPGALHAANQEWDVVPAFGVKTGRRNVIHLFDKKRPGQKRGVPYLAPVIEALKQLGDYTEAELTAAVVSGLFTVFIETEFGHSDGLGDEIQQNGSSNNSEVGLGSGAIVDLAKGEKVSSANPGRPNSAFDPFVIAILRQVGAALQIPFELLVKHFTASYSASRAAINEAWKFFKTRRKWVVDYLCTPVLEEFLTEAVSRGFINAPGFLTDPLVRKAYLGAVWTGPARGQINELQEVNAAKERVAAGFSNESIETAEMTGGDWDQNTRQRAKELRIKRSEKIPIAVPSNTEEPPIPDPSEQDNID